VISIGNSRITLICHFRIISSLIVIQDKAVEFLSSRTHVRDLVVNSVNTRTNERFLIFIRNDKRRSEDGFLIGPVLSSGEVYLEMTVMIVTFFNASGIDFGNFLNAHLRFKILSPNYVTSTAMT
jgi:hypothetical protein